MFLFIFVQYAIANCIKVLFQAKNRNESDISVAGLVSTVYGIFDENNSFIDISTDHNSENNALISNPLYTKINNSVLLEYIYFDITKFESNLTNFLSRNQDNFKGYLYLGDHISMDNFLCFIKLLNISCEDCLKYDANTFYEILNTIEYLDLFGNCREIIINNLVKCFLLTEKAIEILFTEYYLYPPFILNSSNVYNEILIQGMKLFNCKCIFEENNLIILHEKEDMDRKTILKTRGVHIFPCMFKKNIFNEFRNYFFGLIGFYMKMSDYAVLNLSKINFLIENDSKIISYFSTISVITIDNCFIKNSFIMIFPNSILHQSLEIINFSNILFDSKTFFEILNFKLKKITLNTCKITEGSFFKDLNLTEASKSLNSLVLTGLLLAKHDIEQISAMINLSELSIENSSICSPLFKHMCKNENSKLKILRFISNCYSFTDVTLIFYLKQLVEVDFYWNKIFYSPFKDDLSNEFRNLQKLKILRLCDVYDFNRKNICGIFCLKNLTELILSKNNFIDQYFLNYIGFLKLEIFKCQNVRLLSEDLNFFSNHLDVMHLNLKDNDINPRNVHYIYKFKNLLTLNLSSNKCITKDKLSDFNLTNIEELKLKHCFINVSHSICRINIYPLENLSFLSFSGNTLNIFDISYIFNLKKLINLNISQCNIKKGYIPFSKNCQIQNLDLSRNELNENDLLALLKIKTLKNLNISHCSLNKNSFKLLNEISKDINIEELNLLNNRLNKRDINMISKFKRLKELNVSSCFLKKSSLGNLKNLSRYNNLETLHISNNNITTEDITSILCILSLKELLMDTCSSQISKICKPILNNLSRIKKLDLQQNDLSLADLDFIVELEYLEILWLSDCRIGVNGLVPFSNAKSHLSLFDLNLRNNTLCACDILAINCFSALEFLDLNSTKLKEGDFSLLTCHRLKKSLSVLILAKNSLNYDDVYNLSTFENIKNLDLSNSIGIPGLIYLFKDSCISKSLESLDLSFSELNSNDIIGILNCQNLLFLTLKYCSLKYGFFSSHDELFSDLKIQSLSLKNNDISSKDLKNIFRISTIRFLCLSYCSLPKDAFDVIENHPTNLNILHLNGNIITKKGLNYICNCFKLKEFSISRCQFNFRFLNCFIDKPILETLEVFKANNNFCNSKDLKNFHNYANDIEYYFDECIDESGRIIEF